MPNPYQTLGRRSLAYTLDNWLWLPLLTLWANPFLAVFVLILVFWLMAFVAAIYRVFMHWTVGSTIGKLLTDLVLVRASDLSRPGLLRILVRESPFVLVFLLALTGVSALPLIVMMLILLHLLGFLWTGLSSQDRSMMDRLSGTVVVRRSWLRQARLALAVGEPVTLAHQVSLPVTAVVPAMLPNRVAAPRVIEIEPEIVSPIASAPIATIRQRLEAFVVDAGVVVALLTVTMRAAGALPGYRLFLSAVIAWLTVAAYTTVTQAVTGSTLGKRHCGLAIVSADAREPVGGYGAFIRGAPCLFAGLLPSLLLLGVADTDFFVPVPEGESRLAYFFDALDASTMLTVTAFAAAQVAWLAIYAHGILFGARRQSLGDQFAETIVVYHPATAGRRPVSGLPTIPR